MKRWQIIVIGLVVIILLALAGTVPAQLRGRGQGFRVCPYSPYQCPLPSKEVCRPLEITGKVTEVFTETHKPGMYPGMALKVKSKKHGRVTVHLGPVWFLERQEFSFQPGDEVTVEGVCYDSAGQTKLVAAEVVHGDNVLILRDSLGRP